MAMPRIAAVLACACVLGGCALAPTSSEDDRRVLAAQADAWDKALVAKDRAGIEANMAPEFRQIRGGGTLVSREEFLRDFLDPEGSVDPYKVEDFEIHLFGDTALLYGRIEMKGKDAGKPCSAHFRYIDTYVRRNGRWQVVSVQVTPIPRK